MTTKLPPGSPPLKLPSGDEHGQLEPLSDSEWEDLPEESTDAPQRASLSRIAKAKRARSEG